MHRDVREIAWHWPTIASCANLFVDLEWLKWDAETLKGFKACLLLAIYTQISISWSSGALI
jgi:hypothetical protein